MWLRKLLPACHNTEAVNDMHINVSAAHHRSSYQPNMGKAIAESICFLEDGKSKRNFKSKTNFSTYFKDAYSSFQMPLMGI